MSIIVNANDIDHMFLVLTDEFTTTPVTLDYWYVTSSNSLASATIDWFNWTKNKQLLFTTATTPEGLIDLHPELFI